MSPTSTSTPTEAPGWSRRRPSSRSGRRAQRRPGPEPVRATRLIDASPERLWRMVSDVTRMGEWSPETTGGKWIGKHHAPVVGARFVGFNRRRWRRWFTGCRVVEAEPGRSFAFDVTVGPFRVARWRYHFEVEGNRTRATETWFDRRGRLLRIVGRITTGVKDRTAHNRESMVATLNALARAATPS